MISTTVRKLSINHVYYIFFDYFGYIERFSSTALLKKASVEQLDSHEAKTAIGTLLVNKHESTQGNIMQCFDRYIALRLFPPCITGIKILHLY